jgi:REP element-mobilizing transposase RayT
MDLTTPPQWFDPAVASHARGRHLPHVSQHGCIYFVNIRLADSIPAERLTAWTAERDAWLKMNPPPHTLEQERHLKRIYSARIERYLDTGKGECLLARKPAQDAVERTLQHDDGQKYLLGEYVIMPNHVHALVQTDCDIEELCKQWLRVSAHRVNNAIGRRGGVWQWEPFDHVVRSAKRLAKCQCYIKDNPRWLTPGTYRLGHGEAGWVVG